MALAARYNVIAAFTREEQARHAVQELTQTGVDRTKPRPTVPGIDASPRIA